MALTVASVRQRVETDLDDATLKTILNGVEQAIDRAAGKAASETETQSALGSPFIALRRPHASITSITERATIYADGVVLAADDYREVGDYEILRLASGTNSRSRWGAEVVVVYVPEVDADLRNSVALDLCQMVVEFRALDREEVGDWEGEQKDYTKRRKALLATIREGRSPIS